MGRLILLLVGLLVLAGCITTKVNRSDIRAKLFSIDRTDGVDREEAVVIAQDYMFKQGIDKHWQVAKPNVRSDGDFWRIIFSPKNLFDFDYHKAKPLYILVLKQDGTIPEQEDSKLRY